jgi:hypothetical protein
MATGKDTAFWSLAAGYRLLATGFLPLAFGF